MKKKHYVMSRCICQECNCELTVPRIHGNQREKGHIKDLYCPVCRDTRKFKEVRYMEHYKNLDGEVVYC